MSQNKGERHVDAVMQVKIVDIDQSTGIETLRCVAPLRDCYPDDDEAYRKARNALTKAGRYYDGGGASPLVVLLSVKDVRDLDPTICDGCGKRKRGWRAKEWLLLCAECE